MDISSPDVDLVFFEVQVGLVTGGEDYIPGIGGLDLAALLFGCLSVFVGVGLVLFSVPFLLLLSGGVLLVFGFVLLIVFSGWFIPELLLAAGLVFLLDGNPFAVVLDEPLLFFLFVGLWFL